MIKSFPYDSPVLRGLLFVGIAGTTMALTQYLLAMNGFWAIAAFGMTWPYALFLLD